MNAKKAKALRRMLRESIKNSGKEIEVIQTSYTYED